MPPPTLVAPDKARLIAAGNRFIDEAQRLDELALKLKQSKITPGSFEAAKQIMERFNVRRNDLVAFIEKLRDAFNELGRQLIKIANSYKGTEDDNKDDAQRLQELISAMSTWFPGIEKTIPPIVGDTPPPK